MPQMRLLRKITYGEFSEFVRGKKSPYNLPEDIKPIPKFDYLEGLCSTSILMPAFGMLLAVAIINVYN